MLTLCRTRRPSFFRCHPRHGQGLVHRRLFMQGLCDAFLDLAIALPFPAALPPYSTTIILTTVVARVALLPVAIWVGECRNLHETILNIFQGKRRTWKIEELVIPEVEKLKPVVSKQVLEQMKKEGIRGEKQFLQETHAKRCIELVREL